LNPSQLGGIAPVGTGANVKMRVEPSLLGGIAPVGTGANVRVE